MTGSQKKIAAVGLGAIVLYLIYQHFAGGGSSSSSSPAATPDPNGTSSDYASLAGQEQGDMAALQGQEQNDVSGLNGQLSDLAGQIAGLAGITPDLSGFATTSDVAALATGEKKTQDALTAQGKTLAALQRKLGAKKTTKTKRTTKHAQGKGHVNHSYSPHPAAGKHGNAHVAPSNHAAKTSPVKGKPKAPSKAPHTVIRNPTKPPARKSPAPARGRR